MMGIITKLDVPVKNVLESVIESEPDDVFIMAWKDGECSYYSSSADTGRNFYYMDKFKHDIFGEKFKSL